MRYWKIILIFVCLAYSVAPYKQSFGKAMKHTKSKREKVLCPPTKAIRIPNKPIYDTSYANNNTIKTAGEFENKYLDKVLIRGIVKDKNCVPIPNASIQIWQEDEYGKKRYDQFSYSFTDRYELNQKQYSTFLGIAVAVSDNNGYFSFVTVIPRVKMKKSKKRSLINISVSHKDFPKLENRILLNPKFPIKRSNKRIIAFKNIDAQYFYRLPTYDFEIILNGVNKYKTY